MIGCAHAAAAEHSIKRLFAAGEKGIWLDPYKSAMYRDAGTSTPVTAVEQSVRRIYCATGSGVYAQASSDAKRPVLSARVNLLLATETLSTQSVTTVAATYTLSFSGSGTITLSGTATGTKSSGSNSITCTAGTLTLTVSGSVTQADLRVSNDGVNLPPYQRVNTATDYDANGFPKYLNFSGGQCLVTPSIDFSGTNKMSVWAGARRFESWAPADILVELSQNTNSYNGAFVLAPNTTPGPLHKLGARGGTTRIDAAASPPATPYTALFLATISLTDPYIRLFRNATEVGSSTTSMGGGNFGNYPIYIGARADSGSYWYGRIYSLIIRGAASSTATINRINQFVNGRTRAY